MGGTTEGALWVTRDSSARCSSGCPDLRRISRDIGFRKLSLDFPDFCGGPVGVEAGFGVFDSFSLSPLMRDVVDLE